MRSGVVEDGEISPAAGTGLTRHDAGMASFVSLLGLTPPVLCLVRMPPPRNSPAETGHTRDGHDHVAHCTHVFVP
jgi:hypothetical protein